MPNEPQITTWQGPEGPSDAAIEKKFREEGLSPSRWSNGPGDRYGVHSHGYHKVLYCVIGGITFDVEGKKFDLRAGDRLDITPGTPHSAVVGPEGVACMEAPK